MSLTLEIIRRNRQIVREIRQNLSKKRFKHTIQVALLAGKLALMYEENPETAVLAALLHDFAREKSAGELLELAKKYKWPLDPVEENQPMLLHGPVAAFMAKEKWGIKDEPILEAIAYHTTGHPKMTRTAMILYLADMLEPGRVYPGVEDLRKLAFTSLELSLLACLNHTIRYLLDKQGLIHPLSIQARNQIILDMKSHEKGEV